MVFGLLDNRPIADASPVDSPTAREVHMADERNRNQAEPRGSGEKGRSSDDLVSREDQFEDADEFEDEEDLDETDEELGSE
jgi:hypothetical protein